MTALLALADGTVFEGTAFGADGEAGGEVVFNTSMTGYQEVLTDPSYCGQIVTMTYPEIGNDGVNAEDVESRAPVRARASSCEEYWRAAEQLARAAVARRLPARARHRRHRGHRHARADAPRLRDTGAASGVIATRRPRSASAWSRKRARARRAWKGSDLVARRDLRRAVRLGRRRLDARAAATPTAADAARRSFVVAYDFGMKCNILRRLRRRAAATCASCPATTPAAEVLAHEARRRLPLATAPAIPPP